MGQKKLETFEQGLAYASKYCSMQESTAKDMKNRLIKYGLEEGLADKVVKKLIEGDYINEERYALLYTRSKIRQSRWGKIKIKRMLIGKGIGIQYINDAFAQIDENEYRQVLQYLFEKKLSSLNVEDEYQKKYRLQYYLSSHGFENELIEEIFADNNLI
ncbi:MAG: RecX family transcriptional regulator [Bacteroidales bacterium]|nr:RecX family transcriptional regulator [Bacteroidales bacterium]